MKAPEDTAIAQPANATCEPRSPACSHLASRGTYSCGSGCRKLASCGSFLSSRICCSVSRPTPFITSHSWSQWFLPGNRGWPVVSSARMQPEVKERAQGRFPPSATDKQHWEEGLA